MKSETLIIFSSLKVGLHEHFQDEKIIILENFFLILNICSTSDAKPQNSIPYWCVEQKYHGKWFDVFLKILCF